MWLHTAPVRSCSLPIWDHETVGVGQRRIVAWDTTGSIAASVVVVSRSRWRRHAAARVCHPLAVSISSSPSSSPRRGRRRYWRPALAPWRTGEGDVLQGTGTELARAVDQCAGVAAVADGERDTGCYESSWDERGWSGEEFGVFGGGFERGEAVIPTTTRRVRRDMRSIRPASRRGTFTPLRYGAAGVEDGAKRTTRRDRCDKSLVTRNPIGAERPDTATTVRRLGARATVIWKTWIRSGPYAV